ncbi:ubiquitin-like domain-containing protein [Nocardioides sp. TF02-7]|uniref:ubiquitin-like domain-containing protein n=1 Tax=Nocardioides sp. TF02-7 TaxID=2917724 RepID=UPI001F05D978|nr:ubiquitin-like domain-containing protein [Nocardioides sp. TF02-7]UMG93643.1 ubiquitin-like domain-containing protein [Nocardioides sp. TF02-7]
MLEAEGIEIGEHDLVQPALDAEVDDGSRIAVRYARQLELTVDGRTSTHWVTALSVDDALAQVGAVHRDARLSTSRGTEIDRGGLSPGGRHPQEADRHPGRQEAAQGRGARPDRPAGAHPARRRARPPRPHHAEARGADHRRRRDRVRRHRRAHQAGGGRGLPRRHDHP